MVQDADLHNPLIPRAGQLRPGEEPANKDLFDEDAVVKEIRGVDGSVRLIDLSWYKTLGDMLDLVWSNQKAVCFALMKAARKFRYAVWGQRMSRELTQALSKFAYFNPGSEGANNKFKEAIASESAFRVYLEEKQELEWNRLQNAIATGGIYMYGGAPGG